MAAYGNPNPDPAGGEDLYDDTGGDPAAKPDEKKEGEGEQTGLLPKAILMGKEFNPGDEVVLKIVRIHDDQVEVAYAPEKSKAHDESEPAPKTEGDSETTSMYE